MTTNGKESPKVEKTVLVVDDEGGIRRMVCRICRNIGVSRVVDAADAKSALDFLEKHSVDLVISDMNMPGESGLKIVNAVRASGRHTAVLIFSGSADKEEQKRVRAAGADIVLCKTPDLTELESSIRKILDIETPKKINSK